MKIDTIQKIFDQNKASALAVDALMQPVMPDAPASVTSKNSAEWMHERLIHSVKEFEDNLDQEHEVGIRLVSFGSESTFHIEDVGYWGPDIIIFKALIITAKRSN